MTIDDRITSSEDFMKWCSQFEGATGIVDRFKLFQYLQKECNATIYAVSEFFEDGQKRFAEHKLKFGTQRYYRGQEYHDRVWERQIQCYLLPPFNRYHGKTSWQSNYFKED